MSFKFDTLSISEIQLDEKNPRFPQVSNQKQAIHAMYEDQKDKLLELAKDIVEFGLNPSTRLIVFKEKGKCIDGDGNRRLTVLKILETPDLIINTKSYGKFIELSKEFKKKKISDVECVVFNSRIDTKHWLEINHLGEQDGKGQIGWNPSQKERFHGKHSLGLDAKEKLFSDGRINQQEYDSMNISTLNRLLESRPGKYALSISTNANETKFNDIDSLEKVYKALVGKAVKVVYHDSDKKNFLTETLGSLEPRDLSKDNSASNNGKKSTRKTVRTSNRGEIIFGEALTLKKSIVNDIYLDICNIYERIYKQDRAGCVEILGFSLRLILDVAAKEHYRVNPIEGSTKQDDLYKKYLKLLKAQPMPQEDKNEFSINTDISNLVAEENLEAFLAKLAHGSVRVDIGMVLRLSKIIGQLLKIHFSAEPTK
jgi:hypothetical protein